MAVKVKVAEHLGGRGLQLAGTPGGTWGAVVAMIWRADMPTVGCHPLVSCETDLVLSNKHWKKVKLSRGSEFFTSGAHCFRKCTPGVPDVCLLGKNIKCIPLLWVKQFSSY